MKIYWSSDLPNRTAILLHTLRRHCRTESFLRFLSAYGFNYSNANTYTFPRTLHAFLFVDTMPLKSFRLVAAGLVWRMETHSARLFRTAAVSCGIVYLLRQAASQPTAKLSNERNAGGRGKYRQLAFSRSYTWKISFSQLWGMTDDIAVLSGSAFPCLGAFEGHRLTQLSVSSWHKPCVSSWHQPSVTGWQCCHRPAGAVSENGPWHLFPTTGYWMAAGSESQIVIEARLSSAP